MDFVVNRLPVIVLALYNLQLSNIGGKLGYYRWKEHICSFIDKHWNEFFPLGCDLWESELLFNFS